MFGSNWREVELALYADSVLAWLGEGGEMLGGAKLVSSPDLIAAGQYTSSIPNRPDLPSGYTTGRLIASEVENVRMSSTDHVDCRSGDGGGHEAQQQGALAAGGLGAGGGCIIICVMTTLMVTLSRCRCRTG